MMSILENMIKLKKEENIYTLILENKPVNALSQNLVSELLLLVNEISDDTRTRGLIITTGLDNFSAGADLKERALMSKENTIDTVYSIKKLFEQIYLLPFQTLSLIKGACLGGGLELALSCDFRIATKDSTFGFPETSLGIIPGAGGTQLLPRLIGLSKAKYLIYSAKKINSELAFKYGLIDKILKDRILEKGLDFMKKFSSQSKLAIKLAKSSIDLGYNAELKSGLNIEFREYIQTLDSKERESSLKKYKNN